MMVSKAGGKEGLEDKRVISLRDENFEKHLTIQYGSVAELEVHMPIGTFPAL